MDPDEVSEMEDDSELVDASPSVVINGPLVKHEEAIAQKVTV